MTHTAESIGGDEVMGALVSMVLACRRDDIEAVRALLDQVGDAGVVLLALLVLVDDLGRAAVGGDDERWQADLQGWMPGLALGERPQPSDPGDAP